MGKPDNRPSTACRGARRGSSRTAVALAWFLIVGTAAHAQAVESPGRAPADAEQLVAPVLESFVPAVYPEDARARGEHGVVQLRLTIDEHGTVTAAEIVDGVSDSLDVAAREAALRFRFVPARRGKTAIPSRILYDYTFELPSPSPTTTPTPSEPTAPALVGLVLLPGAVRRPVAGARVRVRDAEGTRHETRTDEHGRFRIDALPPGRVDIEIDAEAVGRTKLASEVVAQHTAEVTARLDATETASIEVTVEGRSAADELRRSALAVDVVETEKAQRESADLGEVLARTKGVGVRRAGGLGSSTRFSLNGLTDDQIRFFVDGVPLEYSGYPFGIASIPVGSVDRVEIHRGVVPIRYGADALGGAVDIVTDDEMGGTHGSASYEIGSFDTHRTALGGSHRHDRSGFFVRGAGFFDFARNDYTIDVEVPDERGRLAPATVRRFHDRYRAGGGNVELGVVDRPWARRLLLKVFSTAYDTQIQHNVVMTVPYGKPVFAEQSIGASLRYENDFDHGLSLQAVAGYAWTRSRFLDTGACVYDWFGRCVRERAIAGEIATPPSDQLTWQQGAYGRLVGGWRMHRQHELRVAFSPTYTTRIGDERLDPDPDERDPTNARRDVFAFVTGLEYQLDVWRDRLQNVLFLKDYVQRLRSSEPVPGVEELRRRDRTTHRVGVGDGLRLRILEWMWIKVSYEWATRLPTPDEIFGDAMLVFANLGIEPETSHNGNLSLDIDARDTVAGSWRLGLNGFVRDADNLIILLGSDRSFGYQNVFTARALGIDAAAGWTSPGNYFAIDGNVTYAPFRNTSKEGTFADFEGDLVPNRPYLFANGTAELGLDDAFTGDDRISLSWYTRYVHGFFRSWESAGITQFKQRVPAQTTHSIAVSYVVRGKLVAFSTTLEMQNVFDANVFDFFGVQRPGRAVYGKLTLSY